MFSSFHSTFRKTSVAALLLVLAGVATVQAPLLSGQSSSAQPDAPAAQPTQAKAPITVQQRIKMRREQRRATAIHDVYAHLYEVYVGGGYLRFTPGDQLQRLNEYSWNGGVTRYYNEKFGVTLDGRGIYGTAYIGPNAVTNSSITHPAVREYTGMIGPTYRFLLKPRYSISGRILGGAAFGTFSSDLGSFTTKELGLYADGSSLAVSASLPFEYNVSPQLGLRLAPEYLLTNFGSTTQNNLGFTGALVIRWGKQ